MTTEPTTVTEPETFTASVEAQHAADLRESRDLTDAEIRSDFVQQVSDERVAAERAVETESRRRWETRAVERAVGDVVEKYLHAGGRTTFVEYTRGVKGVVRDLEGVTITVTVSDLVATATLTPPTA